MHRSIKACFGKPIGAKHFSGEIWQRHKLKNDSEKVASAAKVFLASVVDQTTARLGGTPARA